jgi:hypothetical protein
MVPRCFPPPHVTPQAGQLYCTNSAAVIRPHRTHSHPFSCRCFCICICFSLNSVTFLPLANPLSAARSDHPSFVTLHCTPSAPQTPHPAKMSRFDTVSRTDSKAGSTLSRNQSLVSGSGGADRARVFCRVGKSMRGDMGSSRWGELGRDAEVRRCGGAADVVAAARLGLPLLPCGKPSVPLQAHSYTSQQQQPSSSVS